jgi:hypothetical protein
LAARAFAYGRAVLTEAYRKCEEVVVRQCRIFWKLHYAAKDADNFLDASAERYYRVMCFGARNLGSAGYPYVRHARPHPGFQPLLIFPAVFCWDPEAQVDLRCGLAAAFLAGASLDFLPYRIGISFCPLAAL